jgi:hypothetical protein
VADFRPQILFKIKQNVVKTLVNSDLYTILKKGHFSFLAEKSCLGKATTFALAVRRSNNSARSHPASIVLIPEFKAIVSPDGMA